MHNSASHYLWLASTAICLLPGCRPDSPTVAVVDRQATETPEPTDKVIAATVPAVADRATDADLPFVTEPSSSEPVTAAMVIRQAGTAAADGLELVVSVRIARGHYMHAAESSDGQFIPISVEVTLPDGIEATSDWQFPPPEKIKGSTLGFRDSILVRRSLKITATSLADSKAATDQTVTAELHYQVCNDELCWPPGQLELSCPIRNGP